MTGFVLLHRSLQRHWLNRPPLCRYGAWVDLLFRAAWQDHPDGQGRIQRRGDVHTSQLELARAWGWSPRAVRRFLTALSTDKMITATYDKRRNGGGTRLHILNFERYQSRGTKPPIKNASERPSNYAGENHSERPSNLHQVTEQQQTTKEVNEELLPANAGKINFWKLWLDVHREAGRKDPIPTGPDTKAGKELAKVVTDPKELKALFCAYLQDTDPFLERSGHALRHLPGRVNAYSDPARAARIKEYGYDPDAAAEELARKSRG